MENSSMEIQQYVEQTAKIMNLSIAPDYLPGVVDNLDRISKMSQLMMNFELPPTIEVAPIFKP